MQRAGIESILGLTMHGGVLRLDPCIAKDWSRFQITVRHRTARYEILVENPDAVCKGVVSAHLDGTALLARPLSLVLLDDGITHQVKVTLGCCVIHGGLDVAKAQAD